MVASVRGKEQAPEEHTHTPNLGESRKKSPDETSTENLNHYSATLIFLNSERTTVSGFVSPRSPQTQF